HHECLILRELLRSAGPLMPELEGLLALLIPLTPSTKSSPAERERAWQNSATASSTTRVTYSSAPSAFAATSYSTEHGVMTWASATARSRTPPQGSKSLSRVLTAS